MVQVFSWGVCKEVWFSPSRGKPDQRHWRCKAFGKGGGKPPQHRRRDRHEVCAPHHWHPCWIHWAQPDWQVGWSVYIVLPLFLYHHHPQNWGNWSERGGSFLPAEHCLPRPQALPGGGRRHWLRHRQERHCEYSHISLTFHSGLAE